MNENTKLEPGDVVQLGPFVRNKAFTGCFMVVSEPKVFGAQGYVQAYYRANWDEMELVGKAVWVAP